MCLSSNRRRASLLPPTASASTCLAGAANHFVVADESLHLHCDRYVGWSREVEFNTTTALSSCPPGMAISLELPDGSCQNCTPGTFKPTADNSRCERCDPGTFQPEPGAAHCLPCAPGSATGSVGATQCEECAPGTHSVDSRRECAPCAAGSFGAGDGGCRMCPPGKAGGNKKKKAPPPPFRGL